MEGYFGNNSNFNRNSPPLNLPIDSLSLYASPRDYDPFARARHYDESVMLRYLLSGSSSSSDEYTTPRNRPPPIGGCLTPRRSPLSPMENLENSPSRRPDLASKAVKIEEDVLVMDEIPVRSMVRSGGGSRSGKMKSLPLTSCGGLQKREICRSWEDFGSCRYGSKCMFAHGKEEIDPRILSMTSSEMVHSKEEIDPRIPSRARFELGHSIEMVHNKEEIDPRVICKIKSESAHNFKEGIDPRIISKAKSEFALGKENIDPRIIISKATSEISMCKSPSNGTWGQKSSSTDNAPTIPHLKEKGIVLLNGDTITRENSPSVRGKNWSPLDDGIQLKLPYPAKNPPSQEAVEEYLNRSLYGAWPAQKKRLPVFEEICPGASHWKPT